MEYPDTFGIMSALAEKLLLDQEEKRLFFEARYGSPSILPSHNLPLERNPYFTGREGLLQQLREQLAAGKSVALTQAISGLGGVGKTQVALEYAYLFQESYHDILWAKADSYEALVAAYTDLARLLLLSERDQADQNVIVAAVRRWLSTHKDWLLILDDVGDLNLVKRFVPSVRQGAVLLTTQMQVTEPVAQAIELGTMSEEEGALFLLRRTHLLRPQAFLDEVPLTKDTVPIAETISREVGGLPLALDQAGAYILETGCSLTDYLALYRQRRAELLQRRGSVPTDHPESVTTTFSLALDRVVLKHTAAPELLHFFAFLAPDAIPEETVLKGAQYLGPTLQSLASDGLAFNAAIEALRAYSLIHRDTVKRMFRIHRLVQAVVKDAMDTTTVHQWIEQAVCAVNAAFPEPDFPQWAVCERYLPHALICAYWITQEHLAIPETIGLLNHAGSYLYEHARYEEAESLYEQALAIQDQCIISDYSDKASLLSNLASAYENHGRYAEAESLFVQALAIYEQQFGLEHPETAKGLRNLAHLYESQGRYSEAELLYQQALGICEQQLGATHLQTAQSLNGLAGLCRKRGKYTSVESLYQRALTICEQQRGPEDPQTATICHNLAQNYEEQGRYSEAETFYQRALTIYERHLGREHRNTATCLVSLANIYWRQNRYTEAEPLYEQALAWNEQYLGPDHPSTMTNLNSLATLYERQGNYGKAEQYYQRVLTTRKQLLGLNHPDTALSLNNLAYLYSLQRRYAEAEVLYQQALSIREQVLGAEHPLVASTLNNLASLYQDQGKYEDSELLYLRSLRIQEQAGERQHPDAATVRFNLVTLYVIQGRYMEAEPLYRQGLQILEQTFGPLHPNLTSALNNLARLYSESAEPEALYLQALRICEQVWSPEHPQVASPLNSLATLYREQGKYEESERIYQRVLQILRQTLEPQHIAIAFALNNLAVLCVHHLGKYEEAEKFYREALQICESRLGLQHAYSRGIGGNYAFLLHTMGRETEALSLEALFNLPQSGE